MPANACSRKRMLHLEELQARAWPAAECVELDGWELRFNRGHSGRANSVNPFHAGIMPPDKKIRACEQRYAAHELPTTFRLAPWARPEGLEEALTRAGYVKRYGADVLVRPLRSFDFHGADAVAIDRGPSENWLRFYAALTDGKAGHPPAALARMLRRVEPPLACARLLQDDRPAAAGVAVLDELHVGIFCVYTHPAVRRQGHARAVCRSLLAWAIARGAINAYLQVRRDNGAARRMYDSMGFEPAYTYCYYRPGPARP